MGSKKGEGGLKGGKAFEQGGGPAEGSLIHIRGLWVSTQSHPKKEGEDHYHYRGKGNQCVAWKCMLIIFLR